MQGGDKNDLPRWHFCDFVHAFMVVFRIQCGEWVENMLLCLSASNPGICIPLFITVFVIGNLVVSHSPQRICNPNNQCKLKQSRVGFWNWVLGSENE